MPPADPGKNLPVEITELDTQISSEPLKMATELLSAQSTGQKKCKIEDTTKYVQKMNGVGQASSSRSVLNKSGTSTKENMLCSQNSVIHYNRETKEKTETDNGDRRTPTNIRGAPCDISMDMKSERDRLRTFAGWPCPFMDPKDLAKAGFYYFHVEDAVRCAFCKVEIGRWVEGDSAMSDHQRWSNNCPFIRGLEVGNIPLDPNEEVIVPRASADTCGRFGIEIRPNSVPERSENIDLSKLGITPSRSPAYPQYATKEARLKTFAAWPLSLKQKPEELADAGFFYTLKGDQTMCFSCGGGLKDWLEEDDPWEQHARWFTKCSYVLMVKGREYVSEINNKMPAILTPDQAADLRGEPSTSSKLPEVVSKPKSLPVQVKKENGASERVDDGRLCKICYTEELGVVFLPCGHIVACVKCAPSLTTCAVCRQPFTATVRAFLS